MSMTFIAIRVFKDWLSSLLIIFLFVALESYNSSVKAKEQNRNEYHVAQVDETRLLVVNGIGLTIEEATRNAAENALNIVVGSFIDSKTLISKKTQIKNGIIEKTKVVSKELQEYSQGSIKSLYVIDSSFTNGVFRVTAKVEVRMQDFRNYIKDLASDEQKISVGLIAGIQADSENDMNSLKIIESIIYPLISGEAVEIIMSEPIRLREYINTLPAGERKFWGKNYKRLYNPDSAIAIPLMLKIKDNFYMNILNKLENISYKRKEYYTKVPSYTMGNGDHLDIAVIDSKSMRHNIYSIRNLGRIVSDIDNRYNPHPLSIGDWDVDMLNNIYGKQEYFSDLSVQIIDANGNIIAAKRFKHKDNMRGGELGLYCQLVTYGDYLFPCHTRPTSLYSKPLMNHAIFREKLLAIIINLDPSKLSRVDNVRVEFTPNK